MNTADKQLWEAQIRYKEHINARLRRTTDSVSPADLLVLEPPLAK